MATITPVQSTEKRKSEAVEVDIPKKLKSHQESPVKEETITDLSDLLEVIDEELTKENDTPLWKKERIENALKRYSGKLSELRRYAHFDPSKNYTRNLIETDNKTYALMLLCWNKGKFSPIHDHPCDGCWVKVIQGTVQEIQYQKKGNKLVQTSDLSASDGVLYMHDTMGLHKVGNPSSEKDAITLHLYAPPFEKCRLWFDTDKADKSSEAVSCFYSEFGRINKC